MRKLFIVLLIGCVIFDVCSIKTILFIVGGLMLFLLYGKLCYDDLSPEEKMMYESEQETKRRRKKREGGVISGLWKAPCKCGGPFSMPGSRNY